jgi:molybdate transport system ATP-binding protein
MIKFDSKISFRNKEMSFSFEINSDRSVLFGKSGSGKSTILKMIAGFFQPDEGEIKINDKVLYSSKNNINLPANLRNIGYLPQEYTLFPHYTVKENILYGVKVKKIDITGDEFNKIIELMCIEDCLDKMPSDLSGGQQQRVALARILIIRPDLLLLDEPFSALDMSIRQSLRDLVCDMTKEFNIPVLFVTHDLEDAYVFGEELIVIDSGRVLEYGLKNDIYHFPKYFETAQLLDFKNIWFVEDVLNFMDLRPKDINMEAYYCIRPENIMILREDLPKKKSLKGIQLSVVIIGIHERGRYIHLLTTDEHNVEFVIHLPEHAFKKLKLFEGKSINILLKEESIVYCGKKYD